MEAHRRGNTHQKDLNRNFPDPMRNGARPADLRPTGKEEKETRLLMDWSQSLRVTGSLNFHEGAIVANYPNDGYKELGGRARYSACPDDATFVHLAKLYAGAHAFMGRSREFKDGITNGSRWYPVYGGMQDWMYYAARMFELTLEVSQNKWPPAALLRKNWEDNFPAIVAFAEEIGFRGLHGRVYDVTAGKGEAQRRPLDAFVEVEGIAWVATSGERFGDYHRPLAPGRYRVSAFRPGYTKQTVEVTLASGDRWVQVSAMRSGGREGSCWAREGRSPRRSLTHRISSIFLQDFELTKDGGGGAGEGVGGAPLEPVATPTTFVSGPAKGRDPPPLQPAPRAAPGPRAAPVGEALRVTGPGAGYAAMRPANSFFLLGLVAGLATLALVNLNSRRRHRRAATRR